MIFTLLPLAGMAAVALSVPQSQGPVRTFPMRILSSDLESRELSMAPDLEAVTTLTELDQVRLTGLPLPTGIQVDLQLERIDLERLKFGFFVDGAARPDLLDGLDLSVWKGSVVGDPGSEVRLSFSNHGTRGWIRSGGDLVHLIPQPDDRGNWAEGTLFATTESQLNRNGQSLGTFCQGQRQVDGSEGDMDPRWLTSAGPETSALLGTDGCNARECTVAMETDYQLFQVFNNLGAETTYVTTLLGFISDRYEEQANTVLTYPYVMFYTTAADPWDTQDMGGNAGDLLDELVNAWAGNIPMDATLGHIISGASLGGGIAYVDVLRISDYAFGVSGNIDSQVNFPIMQQTANWDFIVISHELGHNFSAPHTHDLCPPIDECAPAGYFGLCQTQQTCTSSGTVMSYCHLCSGGTGNITTYFHPEMGARMQFASERALPLYYGTVAGEDIPAIFERIETPITAQVSGTTPVTGVEVMYRYDEGPFESMPMVDQGGGMYSAELPRANCSAKPEYYFVYSSPTCGIGTDPLAAPESTYSAAVGIPTVLFTDDFESNTGWSVEDLGAGSGAWTRTTPNDDPFALYDPKHDYDGSGLCYVTGPSSVDVSGGATGLISPSLNTFTETVSVQYAYYLGLSNEDGIDALVVEWSANGTDGPWVEIARHTTDALDWRTHVITPSELRGAGVEFSTDTRVRFTANDNGASSWVEAGVDAFRLVSLDCTDGGASTFCATSANSASSGAVIFSFGSVSLLGNGFRLVAGAAVPNTSGLFYYGSEQLQVPFGDGLRCVGGTTQRLYPAVQTSPEGTAIRQLDFNAPPLSAGPTMITIGSTWNFQYWFRDQAAGKSGFNLSNGLSVTFAP